MSRRSVAVLASLFAVGLFWQTVNADGILKHHHRSPPVCEPGFKIVEEVVYQDVAKNVCKQVQEFKEKWVYSTIDDPFCIQDHCKAKCEHCAGPYCRKLLVKHKVLEPCPTTKCVVETIVERVAVVVYKKVPCAPGEVTPPSIIMPPATNGKSEFIPAKPLPVDGKKKS